MHLVRLFNDQAPGELRRMGFLAAVSGLASALLLALINTVANLAASGTAPGFGKLGLYLLAFLVYGIAMRGALTRANMVIERLVKGLRIRLAGKIRNSELPIIEGLGRGELYTKLFHSTNELSYIFPLIVNACQEAILLVFCLIYIAYISVAAAAVIGAATALAVGIYYRRREAIQASFVEARIQEAQLLDSVGHVVDGFKEIRINVRKSNAVFGEVQDHTRALRETMTLVSKLQVFLMLFTTVFVYGLLGVIVFLLPQYVSTYEAVIFKVTAAFLFCIGPLAGLVTLMPLAWNAEAGLASIDELEATLESGSLALSPKGTGEELRDFGELTYKNFTFQYLDGNGERLFEVGPLNLTLTRGEILFIVGGNGSGKSTCLKLITGLYPARTGVVLKDGRAIKPGRLPALRALYSCTFNDFHLFDRLYGQESVDPADVTRLIERMGLAGKVRYENGRFSQTDLSTGQRKRLALIVALLEDRPIYVFDELTSDQDAQFRHQFYTEILPELKRRGKTVIAVTHDERYWSSADRVLELDFGQVVPAAG